MFDPGETIYYLMDNRVHSAPVLARMTVDNLSQEKAYTKEQKDLYMPFGAAGVFYYTCHGIIEGEEAFGSKSELLASL